MTSCIGILNDPVKTAMLIVLLALEIPAAIALAIMWKRAKKMADRCVRCGEIIPEGRQVCPNCEQALKSSRREEIDFDYAAEDD